MDSTKNEFEVDGASAVFSTWRVQVVDLLGTDGAVIVLDAHMTHESAANISEGEFILRLNFLRKGGDS